jgi:hypothetical protein
MHVRENNHGEGFAVIGESAVPASACSKLQQECHGQKKDEKSHISVVHVHNNPPVI